MLESGRRIAVNWTYTQCTTAGSRIAPLDDACGLRLPSLDPRLSFAVVGGYAKILLKFDDRSGSACVQPGWGLDRAARGTGLVLGACWPLFADAGEVQLASKSYFCSRTATLGKSLLGGARGQELAAARTRIHGHLCAARAAIFALASSRQLADRLAIDSVLREKTSLQGQVAEAAMKLIRQTRPRQGLGPEISGLLSLRCGLLRSLGGGRYCLGCRSCCL